MLSRVLSHCINRVATVPRLQIRHRREICAVPQSSKAAMDVSFLSQEEAIAVDVELMGPLGFSVDQLMELAGLSVACSLAAEYPVDTNSRILVMAGPGNNGGDGLVASRHLHHFGYSVQVCYPKRTDKALYRGLVTQCESLGLPFLEPTELPESLAASYDIVVDALFGFSFTGVPRAPFDGLLDRLRPTAKPPQVVSVDIPSGWHVENGDEDGLGLRPDMLVSLTAPKQAARSFTGAHHYLGGRFVPPAIKEKFNLKLPQYEGASMCTKISHKAPVAADMRVSYTKSQLDESEVVQDPIQQFRSWFDDASLVPEIKEPNAMAIATANSDGVPSVRMVLLKGFDQRGFVFYTNFGSRKGGELLANPNAAMTMWWEPLQRSVRVEGSVEKVADDEADEYYHSRPRGSQLGAWVSHQSSVVSNRKVLEDKEIEVMQRFGDDESVEIPRPPFWGGYRLVPTRIEFWQGRPSRLHDRMEYTRPDSSTAQWILQRLSP